MLIYYLYLRYVSKTRVHTLINKTQTVAFKRNEIVIYLNMLLSNKAVFNE